MSKLRRASLGAAGILVPIVALFATHEDDVLGGLPEGEAIAPVVRAVDPLAGRQALDPEARLRALGYVGPSGRSTTAVRDLPDAKDNGARLQVAGGAGTPR